MHTQSSTPIINPPPPAPCCSTEPSVARTYLRKWVGDIGQGETRLLTHWVPQPTPADLLGARVAKLYDYCHCFFHRAWSAWLRHVYLPALAHLTTSPTGCTPPTALPSALITRPPCLLAVAPDEVPDVRHIVDWQYYK